MVDSNAPKKKKMGKLDYTDSYAIFKTGLAQFWNLGKSSS